jgi:hypothetical protein
MSEKGTYTEMPQIKTVSCLELRQNSAGRLGKSRPTLGGRGYSLRDGDPKWKPPSSS